jgi:hypothetical protein
MMSEPKDIRVTNLFQWLSGVGATAFGLILVWVGSTLMDVKQSVAVLQVQMLPASIRMDRIEQKLEVTQSQTARIENRVTAIEARQVRTVGP